MKHPKPQEGSMTTDDLDRMDATARNGSAWPESTQSRADVLALTAEVRRLAVELESVTAERDRLQRACDEGLPREVIPCPSCKVPHVEGPRHDGKGDGRTRPHHNHRCYHCGHEWESCRWSFGVVLGGENEVTRRLRAEGHADGLHEQRAGVQ